MRSFVQTRRQPDPEFKNRQIALEHLADAWESAANDGIASESVAHAAIFAALASLVGNFDEEAVADLVATLPDRIRAGEFTLDRTIQ